jgi:hypothetical protein
VEQWLDVAVDESEFTLSSQGPIADSSHMAERPRLIQTYIGDEEVNEGGGEETTESTPDPSETASLRLPTLEEICAKYDELAAPSQKGEGGTKALAQRCEGAELILEHRQRIVASDDSEWLWRLSAACYIIATKELVIKRLTTLPDESRDLLLEGLKYAEEVASRGRWEGHKWAAVCVGILAKFPVGLNEKLAHGKLFLDHITKALELQPDDDVLHYMNGRFLFEVAGVSWYVLKAATVIFGDAPQATYDDALKQFLAATRNASGCFSQAHTLWR